MTHTHHENDKIGGYCNDSIICSRNYIWYWCRNGDR